MSTMTGSDAQIEWATRIKAGFCADFPELAPHVDGITSAAAWIDNRDRRDRIAATAVRSLLAASNESEIIAIAASLTRRDCAKSLA